MSGAIYPLPQYAFMARCLVKKHRDIFFSIPSQYLLGLTVIKHRIICVVFQALAAIVLNHKKYTVSLKKRDFLLYLGRHLSSLDFLHSSLSPLIQFHLLPVTN
jgi:hypothetical protein